MGGERKRRSFLIGIVTVLCLFEFANYVTIFVANEVYDPVPTSLLRALDILKP